MRLLFAPTTARRSRGRAAVWYRRHAHSRHVPQLVNLTPFAAELLPAMDREDEDLALVVVAGRFALPPGGRPRVDPPAVHEQQQPVRLADEHWGDPATSSLRYEGQASPTRPGTDIYLVGHAWAPGGKPAPRAQVALRVGPCQRGAVVFGERYWREGLGGLQPSSPVPFSQLPIVYERCFGGRIESSSSAAAEASDRNPVGRGLLARPRQAAGELLPNFEDPNRLIATPSDHPPPQGFGPIARHWLPRRTFAGTYDAQWLESRAPLWPPDLDDRFFCAASDGLCAVPHLRGGEPVRLVGVSPDGPIDFALPTIRLRCKLDFHARSVRRAMVLDAVVLEPDDGSFTLVWRASERVGKQPLALEAVVVRELEPWEADP